MVVVPRPGDDSIVADPPSTAVRSSRLVRPEPAHHLRGLEPATVVADPEDQLGARRVQLDDDPLGMRVLGGVLYSLTTAEVERCLDVRRRPLGDSADHVDRQAGLASGRRYHLQSDRQTALCEHLRAAAPTELLDGGASRLCTGDETGQRIRDRRGPRSDCRSQSDEGGHQLLLRTVVDVTLEPLTLGILGAPRPAGATG